MKTKCISTRTMNCLSEIILVCFLFILVLVAVRTHEKDTATNENHMNNADVSNINSRIQLRLVTTCTTPNDDDGVCIDLKRCEKLKNYAKSESTQAFFEESKCGPKNFRFENKKNPKVCCGKYSNYIHSELPDPLPKVCGYQNVILQDRIFGGTEAQLSEFPWMARLIHKDADNSKRFGCSGFVISSTIILTAAHCLHSENVDLFGPIFEVQLGEHNTKTKIDCNKKNTTCAPKPQIIRVVKRVIHAKYRRDSRDQQNDIGLVVLKTAATFNEYVSPICLLQNVDFAPFEYWLSGWGSTANASMSPVKMKVSVPPFSHSDCTDKYKNIRVEITDRQLCAGGKKNKDSCTGDSGGPLMIVKNGNQWFASGIVSFGLDCGTEGWPGVYTNVTSYKAWIINAILNHRPKKRIKTKSVR